MAILRVSNQSQLDAAVRNVGGGDTILLSSGTYSKLEIKESFASKVTIASANPGAPAVINSMLLRGAANVEVKAVKLDYVPGKTGTTPFVINDARKITINDVTVEGQVVNGYGKGIGLRVTKSQEIAVINSEVSNFERGLSFSTNTNVTISNNDFRGMSLDAMMLGGIVQGRIEGNDFRAMKSPAALRHKDMIQFLTGPVDAPSRDIVIRNNVIDNPEVSHGIFFGNALAKGGNLGAFYRNILIEDNYIRSAHVHGITMEHGSGVTIRDNTLIANGDKGYRADINIPLINASKSSVNVTIQGNKVASVPDAQSSWNVSGNVTGSRDLMHWQGDGATLRTSSGSFSAAAAEEPSFASWGGDALASDSARIAGEEEDRGGNGREDLFQLRAEDAAALEEVDFSEGDVLVFKDFDAGSFAAKRGGNRLDVGDGGRSVEVDSLLDLQELVAQSDEVSASTKGDTLILRVEQDGEATEIALEGLGAEFRDADYPDLF